MACLEALRDERNYETVLIYYKIYLPGAPAQCKPWHPPQGTSAPVPVPPASPSFPTGSTSRSAIVTLCWAETVAVIPFIIILSVSCSVSFPSYRRNEHLEELCVSTTKPNGNPGNGKEHPDLQFSLFL